MVLKDAFVQVQTLLQMPYVQNESEGNWMDHLASLIQMEIENDGSFLDIGDVSPVDIKAERSAGALSEKRQLQQVADAPTSGSLQLVIQKDNESFWDSERQGNFAKHKGTMQQCAFTKSQRGRDCA